MNYEYLKLQPFKWFVIQNFPFIEAEFDAMTNYELFCKLGKEINKIIENVNLNGEQVEALTTAYNNLYDYVSNYFDNLNVQEEINNKLDEMVTDGTMATLVNEEMQTLLTSIETDITNIKARLDLLEADKVVCIGDSYSTGSTAGQQFAVEGWTERLQELLGLSDSNFQWYGEGGAGLISRGHDGHNFLELLQAHISDITNKDKVKYFILAGGYNDQSQSVSDLYTALKTFINYTKTQFPNAKIYVGMLGNNSALTSAGLSTRRNLRETVLFEYKRANEFGAYYMTGIENVLHNYDLMSSDFIHPTETGYKEIARAMYQVLACGSHVPYYRFDEATVEGDNVTSTNLSIKTKLYDNEVVFALTGYVNFTNNISINAVDTEFVVGTLTKSKFFRRSTEDAIFSTPVILTKADDSRIATMGIIRITYDGILKCTLMNTDTTLSIKKISFYRATHNVNNVFC